MKVDLKKITIKKISTQESSVMDLEKCTFLKQGNTFDVDKKIQSYMVRMIENVCISYPKSTPIYSVELDYGNYQKVYLIDPTHNRAIENIERKLQGYTV